MAAQDRDPLYTNDGVNRTVYARESNSTGWFVGIIVALALLAIAYLVFSANSQPVTTTNLDVNTPATTVVPPADTNTTPMAPADTAPANTAPADTAPVDAAPVEPAPANPAPAEPAPAN
ncbi:MAG: hypothetical protein ABIO40_04405 [Devosia sp.]